MKNLRLRHFDGFIVLTVVFLFVAAMFSHAQVSGGQQAPTGPTYSVPDHPAHANYGDLRPETSLLGSGVTVAHGERPLSDFPSIYKVETTLGDVAREFREEHKNAEKAQIVWNGNEDGIIRLNYHGLK